MTTIEKKYLIRFCWIVLLYIAGGDAKVEAGQLADRIRIVFTETFEQ